MKIRLASPITIDSVVDGVGLRTVIWCQGCYRNCPDCHNRDTHAITGGFEKDINELVQEILSVDLQTGVTFSGGEPMLQPLSCAYVAQQLKAAGKNIWCFTGFKFEELLNAPKYLVFLQNIDVLVDGDFQADLKSYNLVFKGSANQRTINVPESLKQNRVIIWED